MTNFSELLGIDKVYCISLKKNEANWDNLLSTISNQGFPNPVIFEGILGSLYKNNDGSVLGVWQEYILKNNLDRNNHEHFSTWGGVGCYMSHVSIWQDVKKNNYKKVLIFEDDIEFSGDFVKSLTNRLPYIPQDYDMLFLDVANCFKFSDFNKYFKKIDGLFFGMHSYIITDKAVDALLPRSFPIELQLDSYISYMGNIANLAMYYTNNLSGQAIHVSSIQSVCWGCDSKKQIKKLKIILLCIVTLIVLSIVWILINSKLKI